MADIRINSLPTTASASSSDDFLALDGATNGTRKLNAYSPTFGGNLTVSGTGTNLLDAGTGTDPLRINSTAASPTWIKMTSGATTLGSIARVGNDFVLQGGTSGAALTLNFGDTGASFSGNLTVSGTGTSSFAGRVNFNGASGIGLPNNTILGFAKSDGTANNWQIYCDTSNGLSFVNTGYAGVAMRMVDTTGNLLLGTVIDGGQKLQVNGTAAFAGTVRSNTQEGFKIAAASGYFAGYEADGTTLNGYLQFINSIGTLLNQSIAGKNIALAIAGTPQLTLTTGNATFAGTGTFGGTVSVSTGAGGSGFSIIRTGAAPSTCTIVNSGGEIISDYNGLGFRWDVGGVTKFTVGSTTSTFAGTVTAAGGSVLAGGYLRIYQGYTPSSSSETATAGTITWDTNYIYVATAANTWKRAALSTW